MEISKLLSSFQVELRVIRSLAECYYVSKSYYTPDPMYILGVDLNAGRNKCLPYYVAWDLILQFNGEERLNALWEEISLYANSCDSPNHSQPEDIIPYAFYTASVGAFVVKRYEESRSFAVKALERLLPPNFDFNSFCSLGRPIPVDKKHTDYVYYYRDESLRMDQLRVCLISLLELQLYSTILIGENSTFSDIKSQVSPLIDSILKLSDTGSDIESQFIFYRLSLIELSQKGASLFTVYQAIKNILEDDYEPDRLCISIVSLFSQLNLRCRKPPNWVSDSFRELAGPLKEEAQKALVRLQSRRALFSLGSRKDLEKKLINNRMKRGNRWVVNVFT